MREKGIRLPRNYTDLWRIVACILVVIGHYASFSIVNNWSSSPIWYAIASQAGYVGVTMFFFLSGFGVSESEKNTHADFLPFIKKRALKLYKPIFVVTILWVLLEVLFLGKSISWYVIYDVLWGFDDSVLWFIKILFGLYLSFYIFVVLKKRTSNKIVSYMALVLCSLLLMYVAHVTEGYSSIGIPCFLLGVVASETKSVRTLNLLLCGGVLMGIVYSVITRDNHGYHSAFNYAIIAFSILFPLWVDANKIFAQRTSIGAFLSVITLDLYLVHMKVLIAMQETGLGGVIC